MRTVSENDDDEDEDEFLITTNNTTTPTTNTTTTINNNTNGKTRHQIVEIEDFDDDHNIAISSGSLNNDARFDAYNNANTNSSLNGRHQEIETINRSKNLQNNGNTKSDVDTDAPPSAKRLKQDDSQLVTVNNNNNNNTSVIALDTKVNT